MRRSRTSCWWRRAREPELTAEAISLFIVELPNAGIRDRTSCKKEGIRASETGLIHIDDAFVPDDCLLGGARAPIR